KVSQMVKEYSLEQNYPNPFNPLTHIRFSIPERNQVRLSIFDILGREIDVLINNEFRDTGKYEVNFDATDLPSGIYFYKLQAGGFTQIRKMNLIK
ncbi:MAG: T9SS type A sorting domain-containing protein, partial [Clostridiales bacterium]